MLHGNNLRRLAALALLALTGLVGCHRAPAEQQVRHAIAAAADAARHDDAGALDDLLTADFDGNDGALDRRRLTGMLRLARFRGEHVSVLLGPVSVERRGSRLLAHFTVTLGGGGGWLPTHLGVYTVDTAWRRQGGDWRCFRARWKRHL